MLFIAMIYLFVCLPFLCAIVQRNDRQFIQLVGMLINLVLVLGLTILVTFGLTGHVIHFSDGLFQKLFLLKFIMLITIIQGVVLVTRRWRQKWLTFELVPVTRTRHWFSWWIFSGALLISVGYFLLSASFWTKANFGLLTPEQIVYNLRQPMTGVDDGFINSFIGGPVLGAITCLISVFLFCNYIRHLQLLVTHKITHHLELKAKRFVLVSVLLFCGLTTVAAIKIDAVGFYEYLTANSPFIEENYVAPNKTKLTFPKQKRNLIYIYAESLESTATSREMGGQMKTNLLPELTALAEQEGVHFSNSNRSFGGAQQLPGTGWTVAGMVAQTSGLPLKVPVDGNSYATDKKNHFLPGVTSLNNILDKHGYQQKILLGSDATFGGRRSYFTQHGNVQIDDLLTARKDGRLPEDYYVWWGYEDSKLFEYAKESALELSKSDQPFNLTMLTENTHHIGGYPEPNMSEKYGDQYSNVIAFSDHQIVEFIKWAQTQSFYQNTTIIVNGDHLGMDVEYYKKIPANKRHAFNLILNAPKASQVQTKNRQFSTMDMFPTTLAAMGVDIKGERLGLGTNLFSTKKTLIEEKGLKKVDKALSAKSKFYNNQFIYDK